MSNYLAQDEVLEKFIILRLTNKENICIEYVVDLAHQNTVTTGFSVDFVCSKNVNFEALRYPLGKVLRETFPEISNGYTGEVEDELLKRAGEKKIIIYHSSCPVERTADRVDYQTKRFNRERISHPCGMYVLSARIVADDTGRSEIDMSNYKFYLVHSILVVSLTEELLAEKEKL